MKLLLCVAALAFLQLARPVPVDSRTERTPQDPKQSHMLTAMYKYAKACKETAGDLRNTSVRLVEDCENKAFCQVQLVLDGLLSNEKDSSVPSALDKMCRSLAAFNQHNHMNCNDGVPKSEKQPTMNFGGLLDHFMDCITRRALSKF